MAYPHARIVRTSRARRAGAAMLATTALAISLSGCAASTASLQPEFQLPAAQQAAIVQANRQAAASVAPALRPTRGTVLLTRTQPVASPAEEQDRLRRLALDAAQAERERLLAEIRSTEARSQAYAASLTSNTAAQLQNYAYRVAGEAAAERASAAEARVGAAAMAELARLRQENQQLANRLADQQQAVLAQAGVQVAALQQTTAAQLTALKDVTEVKLTESGKREDARQQASATRFEALQQATEARIAALQQSTEARLASAQETTAVKLAEAEKRDDVRMAFARQQMESAKAETARVNEQLRSYAAAEIARLQLETNQSLTQMAEAARLDVLDLEAATGTKLAELREGTARQSALLASRTAATLEQKITESEERSLKPAQVQALAADAVAEATPQFRALALQTLAESQNYIRTVARDAIKDGDPAVSEALAAAAQQVITKDDKVVFALRRVVDEQLKQANLATSDDGSRTTLGPDHLPPQLITANDIPLDAARLGVKAPSEGGTTATGAGTEASRLAMFKQPPAMGAARTRADWVDLRSYRVVVHADNLTLQQLLGRILTDAEPYTGPWQVKWKVSPENNDVLTEKFSLDAETSFEEFINYLAQYMMNDRGIKLTVSLFDRERVMVISD